MSSPGGIGCPDVASDRPVGELAREIVSGAVSLAAATAAWLSLVAEFDNREGWAVTGVKSCAHWLAWQCGLGPGAAREHVRVARALRTLPVLSEAFAAGRLSFSKVRALTRVAEPATEESLLHFATHATASQVERVVRAWRRADAVESGALSREPVFDHFWDDDGMLCLRARMPAEEGAAFLAAIESLVERRMRRERAAAKRALGAADRTRTGAVERGGCGVQQQAGREHAGGRPSGADSGETFPRERRGALRCAAMGRLAVAAVNADGRAGDPPRREVVVHVDAGVLADDAAAGRAHIEGGPALHPSQVRRMLCEATVVGIVESDGDVLAQGRRRRYATKAQRRALLARDGGCARPGCEETRVERLHAHHLRHWHHGGRTDVSGMVLLCDVDHGLAHDEDLTMTRRRGELVVIDRHGRRIWGRADDAFTRGLDGTDRLHDPTGKKNSTAPGFFVGVGPIDRQVGPRPSTDTDEDAVVLPLTRPCARGRATVAEALSGLSPDGLPTDLPAGGERMDLQHVVWVLLTNRDVLRRRAA